MPGWVVWVVELFRRRKQIEGAVESAGELVREVESAIHGDPEPQPLTWRDVEHIRSQQRAATMHGVQPPKPGPVKAVPRKLPPPPPRPRNRGEPKK